MIWHNLADFYDQELEQRRKNDPSLPTGFGCLNLLEYIKREDFAGSRILDFGCGTGLELLRLHKAFNLHSGLGIDLSPKMIEQANLKFKEAHLENKLQARCLNLLELEDSDFNLILSNAVLHLNPDKPPLIRKLFDLLNQYGLYISADFVVSQTLPASWKAEFSNSSGSFLFGGLESKDAYFRHFVEAGFEEIEILKTLEFEPQKQILNLLTAMKGTKRAQELIQEVSTTKFMILVFRCQKNLPRLKTQMTCFNCGKTALVTALQSLNAQIHPKLWQNPEIFIFNTCSCGYQDLPCLIQFHDMEQKIMAFGLPESLRMQMGFMQKEILNLQPRLPDYRLLVLCGINELKQVLWNRHR